MDGQMLPNALSPCYVVDKNDNDNKYLPLTTCGTVDRSKKHLNICNRNMLMNLLSKFNTIPFEKLPATFILK